MYESIIAEDFNMDKYIYLFFLLDLAPGAWPTLYVKQKQREDVYENCKAACYTTQNPF